MPLVSLSKTNNTLKGPYKPYRYRVEGFIDGVPFVKKYRSMRGVNHLKQQQGITSFSFVVLS
jgi:hypothetical protein